ncbi:MAG: hypothetical protein LBC40_09805 [Dysgonamonadaceae bacterium]|jgi:hypothetical protein|nr:hypothetical protein [Dysgonamonadaceae bacterium]
MANKKDYFRDIIEEYNAHFQSWGNSASWGLTEFKMLEDLIYKSSKMRINAITLERFFHQKTSNPQTATSNALCMFLGYAGYAEFITEKNNQAKKLPANSYPEHREAQPAPLPETPAASHEAKVAGGERHFGNGIYVTIILILLVSLCMVFFKENIKEKYDHSFFSSVVFRLVSPVKGFAPYTVKIEYDIPDRLMEHIRIDCIEANGDMVTKQLLAEQHDFYATFIYPGTGYCQLRYKDHVIQTISILSRTRGWSTYIKEERSGDYFVLPFSDTETVNGYLTLPIERIAPKAVTDKLFVSYTYYTDSLVDGDNFIIEARIRNSVDHDHGIPCYDVMMYAFSDTSLHGFALNENCYSYLKFVSSENTVLGGTHDFRHVNFDPQSWHVMRIRVVNKKTSFYLDDNIVLQLDYKVSLGMVNEFTFRFKGCGAVDYVKVMNLREEIIYREDFDTR